MADACTNATVTSCSSSTGNSATVTPPPPPDPPVPIIYPDLTDAQFAVFLAAFAGNAKVDVTVSPSSGAVTGVTAHR